MFMLASRYRAHQHQVRVSPTHDNQTLAKRQTKSWPNRNKEQRTNIVHAWCIVHSSQKKHHNARKKRAEHRGAVAVPTGRRAGRRGDAGSEPGHGLAFCDEVDAWQDGEVEVGVEAGPDKDGTAARADGGRVRREVEEGYVRLRVERSDDRTGEVRPRDVGDGASTFL